MTVEATIEELGSRPGTGETITIIDPVTEQEIAQFVDGGAGQSKTRSGALGRHLIRGCGIRNPRLSGPRCCGGSPSYSRHGPTNWPSWTL